MSARNDETSEPDGARLSAGRRKPAIAEATPSMAQYLEIKTANPDSLLWYRMGDFYELFFEDAVVAAEALGIVLTKRGKHLGEDIPMCGVPVHKADEYLQRLIRQGFRVAVCEQLEDPAEARKRGSKAVVRRDVVRLVTPGTLTEDTLLDARSRNYLTALAIIPPNQRTADGAGVALASLDISTGEFEVGSALLTDLSGELARLGPREILVSDKAGMDEACKQAIAISGAAVTPLAAAFFDPLAGERELKAKLGVAELGGFGTFSRVELAAIGALLKYVDLTQIGKKPLIRPPKRSSADNILLIDAASRASLELTRTSSGDKRGSLLHAIDRTVTGPGARELAARLASPLRDVEAINARLDAVGYLLEEADLRRDLRSGLRAAPDIARALSRLSFGRGGPRDLGAIRDGLAAARECSRLLSEKGCVIGLPAQLEEIAGTLAAAPASLREDLARALNDDLPLLRRDGGFIREGYSAELDEARHLKEAGRQVMLDLEARYQQLSGVKTLKIRHNNILGYFIEVGQASAQPLLHPPHSDLFRHRQTLASAIRFTTEELILTEGRIATAGERATSLEQSIFSDLARAAEAAEATLASIAAALADLDVAAALAELAEQEGYFRPIVEEGTALDIRGGRHPVVEQALKAARQGPFIENDCVLGKTASGPGGDNAAEPDGAPDDADEPAPRAARIWLLTGPNMAGKSTFLRQNAVICLMAQMGAFVPARYARIGVLDRLFSRVGAADDLARGRSTFMVEMVETAAILNAATPSSLVILDEIGRGTATFDGLSIAWATIEYLHEVCRCRTLFATHYHELTVLPDRLPEVANVTMEVKEWRDEIVFLHKVRAGAADGSYGIQVAKLAGLPAQVTSRAAEVLALLEDADRRGSATPETILDDLPLFAASRAVTEEASVPSVQSEIEIALDEIDPDDLTPRAALEALYRLKALRQKSSA